MDDAFQIISRRSFFGSLSPSNDKKLTSSKWQSTNLALKTSHVKGLRYLMIDVEDPFLCIVEVQLELVQCIQTLVNGKDLEFDQSTN